MARGAFNPIVSDGQNLYLVGFGSVARLEPLSVAEERKRAKREAAQKKAAKKRQAEKRKRQAAKKKKRSKQG